MIDFGMNVQQAGDAARYQHSGSRNSYEPLAQDSTGLGRVFVEPGIRPQEIEKLRKLGHQVSIAWGSRYGGYQAIMRDPHTGFYYGGSDMRKDGSALGY
jgi:gamma-glutamyltranspeptidase / glutathione hydrolase